MERFKDWRLQAQRDLQAARNCARDGLHEHASFHAQQCAEKALKAVYLWRMEEVWGHSVEGLLRNLPDELAVPPDLVKCAERLDKHYVGARYPSGWQFGAPKDHYTEEMSREAIGDSEAILTWCDGLLPRP